MSITLAAGYSWTDGEVVTATKLNLAAVPTVSGNGTYAFANGSAGSPSISFNSESTLGFYRYGAGEVGLSGNLKAINATVDSILQFGQDSSHNMNFVWTYNATAGNASAVFGTFGKSNDLTIQGKTINFDSSSLAFALRIVAAGRVIAGGGGVADDGASALQTTSFAATSIGATTPGTGAFTTLTASPTIAAGTYGVVFTNGSGTGTARDIFRASMAGYSNGFSVQYNGSNMVYMMPDGDLSVGGVTTTQTLITSTHTPSSASDTGTTGTVTWDANFLYVCTASNTWKRVAIATF